MDLSKDRRLILGTRQWSAPYGIANRTGPPDAGALREMLALARESGVCQLETGPDGGGSEALVGALTAGDAHWRVVTELGRAAFQPGLPLAEALVRVDASLEASRRALHRPRLDAVLLQRAAHRYAQGGRLWRRLLEERRADRLAALGVVALTPEEAWSLVEDPDIEIIRVAASLLDQRLLRAGFFDRARDRGVQLQVQSVFLQGVAHLAPASLPAFLAACAPALRRVARFGLAETTNVPALFLWHARELGGARPTTRIVVGSERPEQLAATLADWRAPGVEACRLADLARQLPVLPDEVLEVERWPSARSDAPLPLRNIGPQRRFTGPAASLPPGA